MKDWLLFAWFGVSVIWDIIVFSTCYDEVFLRGHSGWWFLFAILITYSPGPIKALYKRFDLEYPKWD